MRPSGVTAVASVKTAPAPPTARLPRWTRCQSVARPSAHEYWHIGETTMRLRSVNDRCVNGSNRAAVAGSGFRTTKRDPGERSCVERASGRGPGWAVVRRGDFDHDDACGTAHSVPSGRKTPLTLFARASAHSLDCLRNRAMPRANCALAGCISFDEMNFVITRSVRTPAISERRKHAV